MVGSIDQNRSPHSVSSTHLNKEVTKHISLLRIELSDKARQKIGYRAERILNNFGNIPLSTGKTIQLGMNDVPVLDQGRFGSCVTFANTAAVDAALNKGDYISQLCLLQLGRYLEKNAYIPSGWNGSLGAICFESNEYIWLR